jgi:hypothetical protein
MAIGGITKEPPERATRKTKEKQNESEERTRNKREYKA